MNFKDRFKLPDESFILNDSILRTDGYYYCKMSMTNYCKNINEGNGIQNPVLESAFSLMYIRVMILYKNGSYYYPHNSIITGIDMKNRNQLDYCNLLKNQNNYISAIQKFELDLIDKKLENSKRYTEGIYEKGIYNIHENDIIKLQSYQGWPLEEYTIEQKAKILNDSTFVIESMEVFEQNDIEKLKDTFHFKKFNVIPEEKCYILENREDFIN